MPPQGWRFAPVLLTLVTAAACLHTSPSPRGQDPVDRAADRITIRFSHPGDAALARRIREALSGALPLAERFGVVRAPVTITIHPTHASLEAATGMQGYAWLRAWATPDSIAVQSVRTWSTEDVTDDELRTLLVHELTHCAMYQAIGTHAGRRIPIWFREGMAAYTAGERSTPPSGPAPEGKPSYRDDAPRAYAHAERVFRTVIDRAGEASIRKLLARLRDGAPFTEAFRDSVGLRSDELEREVTLAEAPPPPRLAPIARTSVGGLPGMPLEP